MQPGSNSIVVTPHVECATNTVHSPSRRPALAMAFCACSVTSIVSPSPRVSSVSSSRCACMLVSLGRGAGAVYEAVPAARHLATAEKVGRMSSRAADVDGGVDVAVPDPLLLPLIEVAADVLRELEIGDVPAVAAPAPRLRPAGPARRARRRASSGGRW